MSKKDSRSDEEKLWSKNFEDDTTDQPYSRVAKKKAEKGAFPVTRTILIVGILVVMVPILTYLLLEKREHAAFQNPADASNTQLVSNKNEERVEASAKAKAEEEKAKEKAEAEKKAKEQTEAEKQAKEQAEAEQQAKEKAEAEQQAKEQAEAEQQAKEKAEADRQAKEKAEAEKQAKEQAEAEKRAKEKAAQQEVSEETTYTVKPGDNLYRIALNHNLTTEQLKAMNGISGNDIRVGQKLKVK